MNYPAQIVSEIYIAAFKQYISQLFSFHSKLNIITGNNGLGKTNLLDAVYYNCFLKSYYSNSDQYAFPFNGDCIELKSKILISDNEYDIKISNKREQKKQVWLNRIPIEKNIEVSGRFPIVFIEPNDQELIVGSAELRRKFLDVTLSMSNPVYLQHIIDYQKVLKQKNALLKQLALGSIDDTLFDIYTEKLIQLNTYIFSERIKFIEAFNKLFKQNYIQIFEGNELVELEYDSKFKNQSIEQVIKQSRRDEFAAQRTILGIHNDDVSITLNNYPAKKIASQGQQKTIVLAMKFAQYEYISSQTKKLPLLFLDDIFDKLDVNRIRKILTLIHQEKMGQIFITYTDANRILSILHDLAITNYKHINIQDYSGNSSI